MRKGIPVYVLSTGKTTVDELWQEYTTGLNGGPAVRSLEEKYGNKWRSFQNGRQMWRDHSYIYDEIERRIKEGAAESVAVEAVQSMLDAHARPVDAKKKRGRQPAAANWKGLIGELKAKYPRDISKKRARDESSEDEVDKDEVTA